MTERCCFRNYLNMGFSNVYKKKNKVNRCSTDLQVTTIHHHNYNVEINNITGILVTFVLTT